MQGAQWLGRACQSLDSRVCSTPEQAAAHCRSPLQRRGSLIKCCRGRRCKSWFWSSLWFCGCGRMSIKENTKAPTIKHQTHTSSSPHNHARPTGVIAVMKCGGCSAVRAEEAKAYSVCGGCREVHYCSQRKHWKTHKPECLSSEEREAQRRVVKESTVRALPFATPLSVTRCARRVSYLKSSLPRLLPASHGVSYPLCVR